MKLQQNPDVQLKVCPQCLPAGRNDSTCTQCKGVYSGVAVDGEFLYWGLAMTAESIRYRHMIARIGALWNVMLGGLASATVAWLIWSTRDDIFDLFDVDFYTSSNEAVNLFWLGGLLWLYLIMRIIRRHKELEPIKAKHDWDDAPAQTTDNAATVDPWKTNGLKKQDRATDIAKSFSRDGMAALERGYRLAEGIHAAQVDTYHLLVGLLTFAQIQGIFVRLGVSTRALQQFAQQFAKPNSSGGKYPVFTQASTSLFFAAYLEARKHHVRFVGLADVLIAVYRSSEPLQEFLYDQGVDGRQMENVVAWVRIKEQLKDQNRRRREAAKHRPKGGTNRAMTALATPFLDSLSQDLTRLAMYGHVQPLVGRDTEMQSLFRVAQGGSGSAMLVGESGTGKEAIIEGLALRMVEEDVPPVLYDKRLIQLSIAKLLAGATPAQAQERLLRVIHEVRRSGNIILYIPNIEDMIGISEGSGGSLDVAEVLAREMEKGGFPMFATTTTENYRRFVSNTATANVFTKIDIEEMSVDQAIQVLEAKAGYVEYEHGIWFSYAALEAAATLSDKFMHEDALPRKAIRVIKESAEAVRSERGKNQLVTKNDVAQVVSERSKVPTTAVTEDEGEKLLRLEHEMHNRVVGQNEAVEVVSAALRRARTSMVSGERTIANFLFLGPTGVGKTELAKTVAQIYFGGEDQMIRLDMSEYQDGTSMTRLIGQAGQQGSGVLTESIRQKPFALLLLDELEKADPKVLNLFLQVMDDGRITDSVGRTIDATNLILIATSNAGTVYVQEQLDAGKPYAEIQDELLRGKLAEFYRPEFLNRFDAIVLFRALNQEEIQQIARLMLKRVERHLDDQGIILQIDEEVVQRLASAGFDPQFGARPMRRTIQDSVENPIAEILLAKKARRGDVIHFTAQGVRVEKRETQASQQQPQ